MHCIGLSILPDPRSSVLRLPVSLSVLQKCKQLGHMKDQCREKLALAPEELDCAICQSKSHTEESCDDLWRSFEPNPATAEKVNSLPVFCYGCGNEGHYGSDCGLSLTRASPSRRETWSKRNLDLYQDPSASKVALAFSIPASAFISTRAADERPNFGGRSIVPKSHVFFEADDDEENEAFIHAPVPQKPKPGRIRFSGKPGGGKDGRASALPPLPPGPPPALPPPATACFPAASKRSTSNPAKAGS